MLQIEVIIKIARIFLCRFIFTALAAVEVLDAKKDADVMYSVLPFYKAENLSTCLGPTLLGGVKAVIKKKFSVDDYFKDCKLYNCTVSTIISGCLRQHWSF